MYSVQSKTETYIAKIQYNKNGQRTYLENGNGTVTTYEYDENNNRLTRLLTQKDVVMQDIKYRYDENGNIIRRTNSDYYTGTKTKKVTTHSYTYDEQDRLTNAEGYYSQSGLVYDNTTRKYETSYLYDVTGNILQKEQTAVATGTGDGYITDVNLTYTNV